MAIGPDGQEAMHVGMASFPHPASSRARPSAPIMSQRQQPARDDARKSSGRSSDQRSHKKSNG